MICNICNIDKDLSDFEKNRKQCKQCRYEKSKCEHNREKRKCIECGGSQLCEHGKRKERCIDCGGSQVCEHGKRKEFCVQCCGSQICVHNKNKSFCKECAGNAICEHNVRKYICKECDGSLLCEHKISKYICKECVGSQVCEHKRIRRQCKDCDGVSLCVHKKREYQCVDCDGLGICEHKCRKSNCVICTPHIACDNCKLNVMSRTKEYHPYCFNCFCVLNPTIEISRKYKTKEFILADALKEMKLEIPFIQDKIIKGGCSKRRPDFLFELFTHTVILENDENGHSGYDTTCEIAKLNETFTDLGDRPLLLIRFNPDKYQNKSCFDKDGKLIKTEWNKRIKILKETLKKHLKEIPTELITIIYLFFD